MIQRDLPGRGSSYSSGQGSRSLGRRRRRRRASGASKEAKSQEGGALRPCKDMAFILSELRSCLQVGAEMGHDPLALSNSSLASALSLGCRGRKVGRWVWETPGSVLPASCCLAGD